LKIEINNKKYRFPESLEDISLKQFLGVQEILLEEEGGTLHKYIKIISYLSQIPEPVLKDTGPQVIEPLLKSIDKLIESNIPESSITELKIDGETYFVNQDFSNSKFGEYIDYDNFLKAYGPLNAIPYILTILLKKEGDSYGSYNPLDRVNIMETLPAQTALGIANFFLQRKMSLNLNTAYCLMIRDQFQKKKEELENSTKVSDGTALLSPFPGKILQRYLQYLQQIFPKFSNF
jgi:hypothetical protein